MDVNDNACCLDPPAAWTFFASRLAPTGDWGIRVISVGWQAAIAGKPAPTEERSCEHPLLTTQQAER
ncbi:hypothetical protein [Pseudomonas laurylsulfatiphila]|uniref:hypothetical protein n=1 Tax=Pseudomonas laurylsulfatiphila TaxID=2011015 RepID=UPI003D210D08